MLRIALLAYFFVCLPPFPAIVSFSNIFFLSTLNIITVMSFIQFIAFPDNSSTKLCYHQTLLALEVELIGLGGKGDLLLSPPLWLLLYILPSPCNY